MGDIVNSEKLQDVSRLHTLFNEAIQAANELHRAELASPLTITLGDEFQGLTMRSSQALPIARYLRYRLMEHGIECRFSIGLVELRTPLNKDRSWNMMGPGLSKTRAKLDEKRDSSLYRFAIDDDVLWQVVLDALGAGVTSIERRWTDRQRYDIVQLLNGRSVQTLAKARNVSVHSIYKVRQSGEFETYTAQWQAIEAILDKADRDHDLT